MFSSEVDPKDEEKYIEKTAEFIHKHNYDMMAIMLLKVHKPLALYYGSISRIMILPYTILFGMGDQSGKLISVFERRENVDKLIDLIERKRENSEKKNALEQIDKEEKGFLKKIKKIIGF